MALALKAKEMMWGLNWFSIQTHLGSSAETQRQKDRFVDVHGLQNQASRILLAERILDAAFKGDSSQINTFDGFLMLEEETRRVKGIATVLLNRDRQEYRKVLPVFS